MRGRAPMAIAAAAAVLSAIGGASAATSVSGSIRVGGTSAGCGISVNCNAMVFACDPALALKDGIDVSIVSVPSALKNTTASFTLSWRQLNPGVSHVRVEFFNFACYLLENASVTLAAQRSIAVPYDAKWMMVTASRATEISWALTTP